jgi:hypothetical protein
LQNALLLDRPNLAEILLNYGAQLSSVNLWTLCDGVDRDISETFEELLTHRFEVNEKDVASLGSKKESATVKEKAEPSPSRIPGSMWSKVHAKFTDRPRKWTWKFISLIQALCPGQQIENIFLSFSLVFLFVSPTIVSLRLSSVALLHSRVSQV